MNNEIWVWEGYNSRGYSDTPIEGAVRFIRADTTTVTEESHDWQCGCGHWNGPNLPFCAACNRRPDIS